MTREAQVKSALKDWIAQRHAGVTAAQIADDTPLIAQKYLSSMQVLDLILLVESLGAASLDPAKMTPQAFHSIDSIYQTFFS